MFSNMYQENASGGKIGGSNINMNPLTWDIFEDAQIADVFWMTTTKGSSGLPADTLKFRNELTGTKVKFSVLMENTVLNAVIGPSITNDPEAADDSKVCFAGSEDGTQTCFTINSKAEATDGQNAPTDVNVELDFTGGFIKMKYSAFSGNLNHDPDFGFFYKKKRNASLVPIQLKSKERVSLPCKI